MLAKKDYSALTLEELLLEEKKIKRNETFAAGFVGFLIGIMVFGVVKNGFGLVYIAIPLFLISGVVANSKVQKQHLKEIQAEIEQKKSSA
jgi:hypothetical protein